MDCARADRVIPPTLRANAGAGTGLGGAQSGSLVREDHSTAPLQAEDWRDVAINFEAGEVRPEQFLLSQKAYLDRLCALHQNGLSLANVLILLRTWSQGASVHILRHVVVQKEWAHQVDLQLTTVLEHLLGVILDEAQRVQGFLKIKDGGLGLGSAAARREIAYIGAWEGGMKPLLHKLSTMARGDEPAVTTVQALRRIWPTWGLQMDALDAALKRKKGPGAKASNWAASAEGDGLKMQRVHSAQV